MATIEEEKVEIIEVTIWVKTRKEIGTLSLTVTSLETSTNMEMNSSIKTELHIIETLQGEKEVDLKIEIDPVHLMQETMQLVLVKINPRVKQETKVATKIKVQKK